MKNVFIFLIAVTVLTFSSCSKESNKQDVEMYYEVYLKTWNSNRPQGDKPISVQPEDLFKKVSEEVDSYVSSYWNLNSNGMPKDHWQCKYEDFEEVLQRGDNAVIARQKREVQKFMDVIYEKNIKPLLDDKETWGKGEFSIWLEYSTYRMESGSYTHNKYAGGNSKPISTFTYKPYGTINGIKIDGTVSDPIVIEIKYSNP